MPEGICVAMSAEMPAGLGWADMMESNVPARNVSPNNDSSVVKVWHTPTGQPGITKLSGLRL